MDGFPAASRKPEQTRGRSKFGGCDGFCKGHAGDSVCMFCVFFLLTMSVGLMKPGNLVVVGHHTTAHFTLYNTTPN